MYNLFKLIGMNSSVELSGTIIGIEYNQLKILVKSIENKKWVDLFPLPNNCGDSNPAGLSSNQFNLTKPGLN